MDININLNAIRTKLDIAHSQILSLCPVGFEKRMQALVELAFNEGGDSDERVGGGVELVEGKQVQVLVEMQVRIAGTQRALVHLEECVSCGGFKEHEHWQKRKAKSGKATRWSLVDYSQVETHDQVEDECREFKSYKSLDLLDRVEN